MHHSCCNLFYVTDRDGTILVTSFRTVCGFPVASMLQFSGCEFETGMCENVFHVVHVTHIQASPFQTHTRKNAKQKPHDEVVLPPRQPIRCCVVWNFVCNALVQFAFRESRGCYGILTGGWGQMIGYQFERNNV